MKRKNYTQIILILFSILVIPLGTVVTVGSGITPEWGKELPEQRVVFSEKKSVDPEHQRMVELLKYYRKIGDRENALKILDQLSTSTVDSLYQPLKVNDISFEVDRKEESEISTETKWETSDVAVMATTNHEKSPSIETLDIGSMDPNIYIAAEYWNGTTSTDDITIRRSPSYGSGPNWWTGGYTLNINSSNPLSLPKIKQVGDQYLGVVWVDEYSATDHDIYFARVNVTDFSDTEVVGIDTSDADHVRPAITSDYIDFPGGSYIYVVYYKVTGSTAQLLFKRSTDDGDTWSDPTVLAEFTQGHVYCSIDYYDVDLYVAYGCYGGSSDDIAVVKSSDFGSTWTSPTVVASNSTNNEWYPEITVCTGDDVYVAYEYHYSSTDRDVCYAYTSDGGSSWNTNNSLAVSLSDERYPSVRSFKGELEVYASYVKLPTQVILREAIYTSPTSWTSELNVKNSAYDVSDDDPVALLPKYSPDGDVGAGVAWAAYVSTDYDIHFNAYWLPCGPGAFSYLSPSNGETSVSLDKDLDWEDSSEANSYDVYFGTSSPPDFVANVSESYYDTGTLSSGTTYYWKVVAKNICGERSGEEWSFTACALPGTFSNISPSNGSTGVSVDVDIDWEDSSGATSYDVYFGTSSPPPYVETKTGSYYDPGTLDYSSTYYWKIVAKNACGITEGSEWNFTTCTLPGTFSNLSPSNGATDVSINVDIDWEDSSGATSYDVYFGASSPPPYVETKTGSYYDPGTLDNSSTYYWKIVAKNSCGSTEGSEWNFTTSILPMPEIDIEAEATGIPDGGSYGFDDCEVGSYLEATFTIENNGSAGLTLDGSPIIVLGGTDADQFSVEQQPTSPVDPGGSTNFIIRFTPTSAGYKSASISIGSNDADEHPYDITLEGTGLVLGSLLINIEPQGAIDAGAQWKRLCTTTWNVSGFEESGISEGNVIVEFKDIPGWLTPDDQIVSITGGDTSVKSGLYVQLTGTGEFVDSGQSLGSESSYGVKLGDLDGDGDLDVFVANYSSPANKVWLNDGSGTYADSGQSLGSGLSFCVALGDIDNDGDLDAFVSNDGPNRVWLNDGSGTFTDSGQSLGSGYSKGVRLGDVDCDGDLDAFIANHDEPNTIWLNDGSGTFTDSGQSLGNSKSMEFAFGDLDDDGDLDVYVANAGNQANKVWLNDGSGTFTDSGQSMGLAWSLDVELGDLDADGDLDAFVSNSSSQANKVWLNDGSGNFTDSGQSLGGSTSLDVEIGDLDGDGDIDAFIANSGNQANKVWLNDGSGNFTDSGQSLGSSYGYGAALGRVDGDSSLDAVVANYLSQANKVWLNVCLTPAIDTQPQSQTIDYNATAALSVTASSSSPVSYQWYQGNSGDTSTPVGTDSDSYTTPNLTETTSYWVRVFNACGSVDSDTATISVLPAPFANLSPADTSTDVALDTALDWEDSTGATSYDVYLDISSPPDYVATVAESYYDPGGLGACETYYWKIVAKNDGGDIEGSEWSFSTLSINPGNFSYLSPADFATEVPLDADLDWEDSTGATTYDVYFGTSDPPPYAATVNESYYDPGVLDSSTTYYWSVFASNSCGTTSPGGWSFTTGQKSWTFMVYLDADNNLEGEGIDDFLEMASVGSNSEINIVVQFDRISGFDTSYGDWTTTKRFYVTNGMTPESENEVEDLGELNHGDPQTLINFVDWVKMNYPAERYALILWNHGGGWRESKEAELRAMQEGKDRPYYRGVCWDDTDSGDYLYTDEVQSALNSTGGAELIGFDACLMAMAEVAYEIRSHGEVMAGSEEVEPGGGWPYDTILQDLANNPGWSSSELGQAIVDRYYESYGDDETQSALDLSAMDSLAGAISAFAQSLIDNWDSDEDAVRSAAQDVMTEIENAVIHEQHGSGWPGAHGLAVYFPASSGNFDSDYNGTVIDFAAETQWDEFLQEFFISMGGSWIAEARAMTQEFYYSWQVDLYDFCFRLVHEPDSYYTESLITNEFIGGGVAQDVHADDSAITYSLPFDFPYFGEVIPAGTDIYICTNGFVDLDSYSTDFSNTVAELIVNKRIAAFWEDLVTNGTAQADEDIYILEDPDYLAIRWIAETLSSDRPVNFELVMHTDGRIQFNYDGGNDLSGTSLSPTIGISKGDGNYYNLSVYNGETLLTDVESDLFTPPSSIEEPLNPSPADGALDVPLDEDLDWDDCAGATSYDIYFGTSSPPPHVATEYSSDYDPGTLALSMTYYWKVVAKNQWGYEAQGAEWQFTTCMALPAEPSNPSPGDTTSGHSLETQLSWEDSGDASSYDVYLGTSSPPEYVATTTENFYDPGPLVACTTYYWKVVARNNCGETEGSEWSFSTIVVTPESFSNISPSNGGTEVSFDADLDWEDSQGAASYDVHFGTSSPPPYVTTVSESSYDPGPLNSGTTYYWMVVAKNNCGDFAGEEWSFTTQLKPWTFMVYLDGDNNLESAGIDDFLEMASVGSNDQVSIVVQFDRIDGYSSSYDNWTSTKRFYITPGMTPSADNALQDLGELNHGDPQTLIDFVDWAKMNYPAERYALVLWNHGGGWRESKEEDLQARLEGKDRPHYRAVCWDDTDGEDTLYMDEVQNALYSTDGADVIGFDACLMGMVEVAYEIKDYGQVMVGSEESEPGDGWPYNTILQDLVDNPSWSSSELGQAIVSRYYESYGEDMTQSAIDLTALDSLAGSISEFAQAMVDNWNTDETAVKDAASELMTQIENAVISEQHGSGWPGAHGIAINFPVISGDFDPDYESVIDFANDTQWEEFLQEFYTAMAGSWIFQRRAITQQFAFPEYVDLYHFCELINTDKEDYYTRSHLSPVYLGGGSAWGFHYDDAARTYNLPFDFPYFGETVPAGTTVYVCTNGFVDFDDFYMDPIGSGRELVDHKRISPFWTDLRTNGSAQSGEDVYITENSQSVVIRWRAQTYYGSVPVNVELVLYDDGRIQFNYDGGNDLSGTPYRPTIGISKGDGMGFNFSSYYAQDYLVDVDSVLYTPISPEPPSQPANPSPAHEETAISLETGLDWDDCARATSYDVYFGTGSPPPLVTTVTSSYYDPGTLDEATTYYWKIVAKNEYGETPGEEWQFTTCDAPGVPTDPSPGNGEVNITNNPILTWSMTIDNASSYDVYFGTVSPPPFVETVTTPSYTPGELDLNTTYFWKVSAKNPCGETHSSEWQFLTTGCPAPSIPSNPSPANNAFDVPVESGLDWDDSTGAISYDVYFGTNSPPPYVGSVTASHYDPGALEESTVYYWKISAKNDCGETFGLEWQFKTIGPKHWTFMVYLDGDNNLEAAGIDDFLEMASIGSSPDANIVVQFDRVGGYSTSYDNWTSTKRFYITNGMTPTEDNALQDLGELNHGDPQTLIDFVNWAKENYPADNYALVLWNHGGGWRLDKQEREARLLQNKKKMSFKAVCWDDTNGHDSLYMDEVQSALNSAGGANLIGFDACLMGMVEVAYEMRDLGEVMVGSEETEPGDGWPYDAILQDLVNNSEWSPAELGSSIVDRYYESYGDSETQSAIDLSNMDNLANSISNLGQAMIDNWSSEPAAVKIAAVSVITEIENSVIREQHGSAWRNAAGLAIYLPQTSGDFDSDYNTVIDFSNDTQWNEFIQAFHSSMGGSWISSMRQLTQDFTYPEHIDLNHFCNLLITEELEFYQYAQISPEYEGGGAAQGLQYDDRVMTYTLPFAFPYFGETIPAGKDIYICTNGYIDFESPIAEFANYVSRLANNKRIAPLWADLRTNGGAQAGEDVYITHNSGLGRDPDNLVIRWVAETYGSAEPVNFELVLYDDGNIQFNYDGGNANLGGDPPIIGISKGDGINLRLSDYNEASSLTDVDSELYTLKEIRTVRLNIEAGGEGTIFPLPGDHAYPVGQQITIAAVPDRYCDLHHWSGDLSGNQSPVTVTVNADMNITANFFRIYPPSNFSVRQELNRTLLMGEDINVLTWQDNASNPSSKIENYNVYSDSGGSSGLLGTVEAGEEGALEYWHRDVDKTQTYNYAVCAVTTRGVEGEPTFRSIQGESEPERTHASRSALTSESQDGKTNARGMPIIIGPSQKEETQDQSKMIHEPLNFAAQMVFDSSMPGGGYMNALSWQANPENRNIKKYMIFIADGEEWKLLAELEGDIYEYQHKGIDRGQKYKYALIAVDKDKKRCKPARVEVK